MIKKTILCLALLASIACNDNASNHLEPQAIDKIETHKTQALLKDEQFTKKFNNLMDEYYHLKNNIILRKTEYVHTYCQQMQIESQKLSFLDVSQDSLAKNYPVQNFDAINQALANMENEKEIPKMLPYFSSVSDLLFDLLKNNYAYSEKAYRLFCSKIFGGKGAYWLNQSGYDQNPYDLSLIFSCSNIVWTNSGIPK